MKLTNLMDKNQFKFIMPLEKHHLRHELKQKRQQLNPKKHQEFSQIIVEKIEKLTIFKNSIHIGIYYPIHQEVNVLALLKNQCKIFYLPRINSQNTLSFHQVNKLENLIPNEWGIPEPSMENLEGIPELLIIPMLGFDLKAHRLGYGKGYYDAYLNTMPKPFCIGVAFAFQQVKNIPHESHDIKMDLIITNQE